MEVEKPKVVHTIYDEPYSPPATDEESIRSTFRTNRSPWSSPEIYFYLEQDVGASSDVFSAALVLLDILFKTRNGFEYPADDSYAHSKKITEPCRLDGPVRSQK